MPWVVLHPLPAGEDEAPARTEPGADGAEGCERLVEEHHAQLADDEVEGLGAEAPGLHVVDDERGVPHADLTRPRRANSTSGWEKSIPTTCPIDPSAPARAMVSAPPPHPMSQTRAPSAHQGRPPPAHTA